jgi:hypothetical protein
LLFILFSYKNFYTLAEPRCFAKADFVFILSITAATVPERQPTLTFSNFGCVAEENIENKRGMTTAAMKEIFVFAAHFGITDLNFRLLLLKKSSFV